MHRVSGSFSLGSGRIALLACGLVFAARVASAQAPGAPPEDLNIATYKAGIAAFEKADYQGAIDELTKLVKAVGSPQAALEAAYFDIAVSYYNLEKYAEAATAFKDYRDKYPKGARVTDASMSLANAYIGVKNWAGALQELAALELIPAQRDQVLFLRASILMEQKKNAEAIKPLEALTANGLRTSLSVRGALILVSLYVEKSEFVKASAMIAAIQRNLSLVDNILRFNSLVIELGDKLLTKSCYKQALSLYHVARSRKEVIQYQQQRIAAIERMIEENKAKYRLTKDVSVLLPNQLLFSSGKEAKVTLDEMQKAPNFEPALLIRIARGYQGDDRPQEASLVYQQIVDKYPEETAEREPAMFGLIATLADGSRQKRALEACETYLKLFPAGPNGNAVSYLRGAMALDSGDYPKAVTYFGKALTERPKSEFADRMTFMTGNAHFMAGDAVSALTAYQKYLKDYPSGEYTEEASYRLALCEMFADKYEDAQKHFTAFNTAHPNSEFAPDVRYRLAVIKYAAREYEPTIADCILWLKQYPGNRSTGEVYALLGDAQAATDHHDTAAESYVKGYKAAMEVGNEEVLNYALFEAGKQLTKLGQPEKVAEVFEEFLKNNPDHSLAPAAVASIIQARSKMGQVEEAKNIAVRAAARFIADPAKESTENLLTQIAALVARRRQKDVDPVAELDRLLTFAPELKVADTPTVKARKLFARAELYTFLRKLKEHDDTMYQIADQIQPGDLSPLLLGECGEILATHDRPLPARAMFEQMISRFPKSDVLDFAYVGLGDLSYAAKDYPKALELYSKAVDEIPSSYRMKEATLGKARALSALNKLDDAAKLFEQVASVKEWRGEATAQALVELGDIEAKRADYAKAIAYYQRVYVAWQKFPRWVARAYIESAHAFEKLGKSEEALNTYKEMIRNEKIANSSEVVEAKKRLTELGQGS